MKQILQNLADLKGKTVTDVCQGFVEADEDFECAFVAIHTEESVLILETLSRFSIEFDVSSCIEVVKSLPAHGINEKVLEQLKLN